MRNWRSNAIYSRHMIYRSLLASRSDSKSVRISPSRTGPFTLRMICRFCSPMNSTLTCVHCPWDPVRPKTLITRAKTTGLSIFREFSSSKSTCKQTAQLLTEKEVNPNDNYGICRKKLTQYVCAAANDIVGKVASCIV